MRSIRSTGRYPPSPETLAPSLDSCARRWGTSPYQRVLYLVRRSWSQAGCTSLRLAIQLWRPYLMLCRQGPTSFEDHHCSPRRWAPWLRLPAHNQCWLACRKHGNCLEYATASLSRRWRHFVSWCATPPRGLLTPTAAVLPSRPESRTGLFARLICLEARDRRWETGARVCLQQEDKSAD